MFPPRVFLAIFVLYIYIYCRCVKSKQTFIISEQLVEKHIIVYDRPVQEFPYQEILSRFNRIQRTPGFGSRKRKFHSFLVTSNKTITIKDLERLYKEAIRNPAKNHVNSMDIKPNPVPVINMVIWRKVETKPYDVTHCEFSNKATFELSANRNVNGRNTEYHINHLYNVSLTSAEECRNFSSKRPPRTC